MEYRVQVVQPRNARSSHRPGWIGVPRMSSPAKARPTCPHPDRGEWRRGTMRLIPQTRRGKRENEREQDHSGEAETDRRVHRAPPRDSV